MEFPPNFISSVASSSLTIGTIIKCHLTITNPPKVKYFIIVGIQDQTLGVVLINSVINEYVNYSHGLKELHIKILAEEYAFLQHTSYIDCSNIQELNKSDIECKVEKNLDSVKGKVSPFLQSQIVEKLCSANTISPRKLRKFSLL